jgi:hypothetical protein
VTTSHIACLRPGAIARNPGYDGDDLIPILDFAANTFSRKTPMPVVGFLHAATPEAYAPTMAAFRKSLSEGCAARPPRAATLPPHRRNLPQDLLAAIGLMTTSAAHTECCVDEAIAGCR